MVAWIVVAFLRLQSKTLSRPLTGPSVMNGVGMLSKNKHNLSTTFLFFRTIALKFDWLEIHHCPQGELFQALEDPTTTCY